MYDSNEPSQVIYQLPPSDGQAAEPDSPTLADIASCLQDMDQNLDASTCTLSSTKSRCNLHK